jgi:hypothetical protein
MRFDQDRWPATVRRCERLIQTHRQLKDRIGRETIGSGVNAVAMQEMKRRKLRTKDSIAAIERLLDGPAGEADRPAQLTGSEKASQRRAVRDRLVLESPVGGRSPSRASVRRLFSSTKTIMRTCPGGWSRRMSIKPTWTVAAFYVYGI